MTAESPMRTPRRIPLCGRHPAQHRTATTEPRLDNVRRYAEAPPHTSAWPYAANMRTYQVRIAAGAHPDLTALGGVFGAVVQPPDRSRP